MNNGIKEKLTFTRGRINEIISSSGFTVKTIDRHKEQYTLGDRIVFIPREAVKINNKRYLLLDIEQGNLHWEEPYKNEPLTKEWLDKLKSDLKQAFEFEEYIVEIDPELEEAKI